jgi:hypothetical protein
MAGVLQQELERITAVHVVFHEENVRHVVSPRRESPGR